MKTTRRKRFTKAKISSDLLFWTFGVELGFIDRDTHSVEELESLIDAAFDKEQIEAIVESFYLQC